MILAWPNNSSSTKQRLHLVRSSTVLILFVGLLFTATARFAVAQDIFGRISGTVMDSSDASVSGAKVTITNEATQISRVLTTDKSGYYVADSLAVGTYSVNVEQQGFKSKKQTGNVLVAGGRLTVDLRLDVGAVAEKVEVVAVGD